MTVISPKPLSLAFCLALVFEPVTACDLSLAQNVPQLEPPLSEHLNRNNLAPTGATVPNLGASQIGAESAQEQGAEEQSDKDTHSICSNCE